MNTYRLFNVINDPQCLACGHQRGQCGCQHSPTRAGAQFCDGCGNDLRICMCDEDDALMPTTIVQSGNHATGLRPEIVIHDDGNDDMLVAPVLDWRAIAANRHRYAPIQSQPIDDETEDMLPLPSMRF